MTSSSKPAVDLAASQNPLSLGPGSSTQHQTAIHPTQSATADQCDLTLRIAGMSCAACQAHVERALRGVPGVASASVDLLGHTAHLQASPSLDPLLLTAALRAAGYDLLPSSVSPQTNSIAGSSASQLASIATLDGESHLGLRALLSLLAGVLAMLLSMPLMSMPVTAAAGGPTGNADLLSRGLMHLTLPVLPAFLLTAPPQTLRWTLLLLAAATMLFAAPEIYRAAWRAARHRATNMNSLVALGTLVAFGASAYTTVSLCIGRPSRNFNDVSFEGVILILAFLLAGRWLETRARERANQSLHSLAQQEPAPVRWVAEGDPSNTAAVTRDPNAFLHRAETLLPLDAIAIGDLLRVLPGDRVPLDGIVLAGQSAVDESMLTGESVPVIRRPGDKLFAGTLDLDGPLLLRATALGADSLQAQMARLLERARATRAPLQRLADRASAIFVPTVLALAALTFLGWALADNTGPNHLGLGRALSFAVAVLVVACPCAMGLAVPAAVAVSLGSAARAGLLIKGGEALERLAGVQTVLFDKTGTLTEGQPEIVAVAVAPGTSYPHDQLLQWAATLETASTHPLAQAVLRYTTALGLQAVPSSGDDLRVLPGLGVQGTLNGHTLFLGRPEHHIPSALQTDPAVPAHATPLQLLVDGQPALSLYALDTARVSAVAAVTQLRSLALRTGLLTGDTLQAAHYTTQELGLDHIQAQQLPADKLAYVAALQQQGNRVAMVGDGLNDAAALAQADVGIAVASGTDLAREAGHVLLLRHDLTLVPAAVRLARRSRRIMQQNLGWAVAYNLLGLPLAAGLLLPRFGLVLSPALASAAMALSSTSVLVNSLRLARPVR